MTRRPGAGWWAVAAAAATLAIAACQERTPGPAPLDTRNDSCRFCRMSVSDIRFAAQIVAPGEEPVFFDDIGCLTHYLAGGDPLPPGAVVYVGDVAARAWVRADEAVFTRVEGLDTPMGSGLVAHGSAEARDADPVARQGQAVALDEVVPVARPGGALR